MDARGADLRGAVFDSCFFERVNFRGANLKGAEFVNCYFEEVDLQGTAFQVTAPEGPFSAMVLGRIIPGDLDRDMVGYDALDIPEIPSLLDEIYRLIQARADDEAADWEELDDYVRKIEQEARVGKLGNPKKVGRWLKFLADVAPDVFWLTTRVLTYPLTRIDPDIRLAARGIRRQVEGVQEYGDNSSG